MSVGDFPKKPKTNRLLIVINILTSQVLTCNRLSKRVMKTFFYTFLIEAYRATGTFV